MNLLIKYIKIKEGTIILLPRLRARLKLAIPVTRSDLPKGVSLGVNLCEIFVFGEADRVVNKAALISVVLGSNTGNL